MMKLKVKKKTPKNSHLKADCRKGGKNKVAFWPLRGRKIHQERKLLSALRAHIIVSCACSLHPSLLPAKQLYLFTKRCSETIMD